MAYEVPESKRREIWREFKKVLDGAIDGRRFSQGHLNDGSDEWIIQTALWRLLEDPQLPWGGGREMRLANKLESLAEKKNFAEKAAAWGAAQKFRATRGCYYFRKPLAKRDKEHAEWKKKRDEAAAERDRDLEWLASLMLDGLPEIVSDFRLEPKFLMMDTTGPASRLVELINKRGERSGTLPMDKREFHAPSDFREFCLGVGNYSSGLNEKNLERLQSDVSRECNRRVVWKVSSMGWRETRRPKPGEEFIEGLWFADGCAIGPAGEAIFPDDDGIYWHGNLGFFPTRDGLEGEYLQAKPKWHPEIRITSVEELSRLRSSFHGSADPADALAIRFENDEKGLTGMLFRECSLKFHDAVGGYDGWTLMGHFLGYAALPEFYEVFGEQFGIWAHGAAESGKTKTISWAMELRGMNGMKSGLDLRKNVTPTGMYIAAGQYSDEPVWFDEMHAAEVGDDKLAVLRTMHNRGLIAKWSPGAAQRRILTSFVVSGETTVNDAAIKGQYAFIHMDAKKRLANNEAWFEENRRWFYFIGRYLLENRREFVASMLGHFRAWCNDERLKGTPERTKKCYGFSYAAFMAAVELLQSHPAPEIGAFKRAQIAFASEASADVAEQRNTNVFLDLVVACWKSGGFEPRYFRVTRTALDHAPGSPGQRFFQDYTLWMDSGPVVAAVQTWLTKQHSGLKLDRKDFQTQLGKAEFFSAKNMRFGKGGSMSWAWGINLNKHPTLGYHPISDEDYAIYLRDTTAGDPRKGPLFEMVEDLWEEEDKRRKADEEERRLMTLAGTEAKA